MPRQLTKDFQQPRYYNNNANPNQRRQYGNRSNYNKNRTPRFAPNENGRYGRGSYFHHNQNQQAHFPEGVTGPFEHVHGEHCLESGDNENGSHFSIPSFSEDGFAVRSEASSDSSNHVHSYPPFVPSPFDLVDKLVEFRFDIVTSMRVNQDTSTPKGHVMFNPPTGRVATVIETVIHYVTQPITVFINGHVVAASLPMPFAQHICISLDDGTARYEEVIRMDSVKYTGLPDLIGQAADFSSVYCRLKFGDQKRRPRFRDGLRASLERLTHGYPTGPMDLIVSRPTGRAIRMDKCIATFFTETKPPFEAHTQPIYQQILQPINFRLSGTPYNIVGHFYRPVLTHSMLLLSAGYFQLLETVSITASYLERRIYSTALDSAFGSRISDERKNGLRIIDAVSYFEIGSDFWGPNMLSHNTRISAYCNPFLNLSMNPVLNRTSDLYQNPTFVPPAIPLLNPGVMADYRHHCRVVPITSLQPPPPTNADMHMDSEKGSQDVRALKTQLNVLAEEFYPVGHDHDSNVKERTKSSEQIKSGAPGPELPVPHVAIMIANPPHAGPDEVYISCMYSDSEDYYEDKPRPPDNKSSIPASEAEEQPDSPKEIVVSAACLDSNSNSNAKPKSSTSPETDASGSVNDSTFTNTNSCSWSEEVENHEYGFE